MSRASRRAFLGLVSAAAVSVTTEATAGLIFRRCRRRHRCVQYQRRAVVVATQPALLQGSCAGVTCLQTLVGEVGDETGCLYRQYEAHVCQADGSYEAVLHERDCSDVTPLPQGSCTNCGQCLNAQQVITVPLFPLRGEGPPQGRKHNAARGLATGGIARYGNAFKPRAGQTVIDQDIILMPGTQAGTNQRRRARLVWVRQRDGQKYGIGFEIAAGEPTILEHDVKHKPLIPGGRPLSYSVTVGKGSDQRHYAVYMKR